MVSTLEASRSYSSHRSICLAYEKYCTLGFYAHGGVFGISKASETKQACIAVNHFLKERFPAQTWTSIAVLYNPSMSLHRDILKMKGHANHAITLGNFMEGRVRVEDENGQATALLETKNGQKCCAERELTCMTRLFRSILEISYVRRASWKHVGSCRTYALPTLSSFHVVFVAGRFHDGSTIRATSSHSKPFLAGC